MPDAPPTIHNLLHKDPNHANLCYDPETVSAIVGIKLKDGPDGHVHGSTFIPGERFAKMMGQADPDTVRLKQVTVTGATTTFGAPMGAHIHYGQEDVDDESISTFDRVMHVVPSSTGVGDVITTHFTVPAASMDGSQTSHFPPSGLGSIKLANSVGTKEEHQSATARAFQRNLRWGHALNKTPEQLAASCTKVGTDEAARFLVPIDGGPDACAMSTLIRSNVEKNGAAFCGGHYSPDKRTVVANARAEPCTVMAGAHFNQVFSQLDDNLKPKSNIQKGVTWHVKSLQKAKLGPSSASSVQLHANFDRMTTASVMDSEHAPVIDKMAAMAMLGEKPEPGFTGFASSSASGGDALVNRVFAMKLSGEDVAVGKRLELPSVAAAATVTEVASGDLTPAGAND